MLATDQDGQAVLRRLIQAALGGVRRGVLAFARRQLLSYGARCGLGEYVGHVELNARRLLQPHGQANRRQRVAAQADQVVGLDVMEVSPDWDSTRMSERMGAYLIINFLAGRYVRSQLAAGR